MSTRVLPLLAVLLPGAALAADCDFNHTINPGETVFTLAQRYYGNEDDWSLIFYANPDTISNPLKVPVGTVLTIPCKEPEIVADATPLQVENADIKMVTGSNYAPFTDKNWPGEGMLTEVINAAMEASPDALTYSITWEDDWSKHLFPMLDSKEFDMGFPWFRPNCEEDPTHERCANFHFSEPLVDLLGLLFVVDGEGFTFESDDDIIGKTLCRPAGYFTFDLDSAERQWLSNGLITLEQPATPADCFDLLIKGDVDAVALNEFMGWTTISDLGLRGQVTPLAKPLGVQGLHVIISKNHWRGTTNMYRFNAGLAALKSTDRYDEIISRHLGVFWDRVN